MTDLRTTGLVSLVWALGLLAPGAGVARAEVATPQEMQRVCKNWLAYLVHQRGDWAGDAAPKITASQEIVAGESVLGRSFSIAPRGFVVIPVLKELPPIKAYSDRHGLDVNRAGGLPQLLREVLEHRVNLFIKRYGSPEASQPRAGDVLFDRANRREWDRFLADGNQLQADLERGVLAPLTEAGPLLTSAWHQASPYNDTCPMGDNPATEADDYTVVGCVATAAAQVMSYHQWPPQGAGNHGYLWHGDYSCEGGWTPGQFLNADFSDTYDWANIRDEYIWDSENNQWVDENGDPCTTAAVDAVAELCYEVGAAYEMDYGACGSGAYTENGLVILPRYFRYDPEMVHELRANHTPETWFGLIQTDINADRPIIYSIRSHSIVCDGWRDTDELNQYHMNYGWRDTSYNAWYTLDNVHCSWSGCDTMVEDLIRNIKPLPDADCQPNGTLDHLDIWDGTSLDCNNNAVPDECDITVGTSDDCQPDGVPDECEIRSVIVPAEDGTCSATATNGAPWGEDFESYPLGSIQGLNSWQGWGSGAGDPDSAGIISTEQNHTPGGSQSLKSDHDAVNFAYSHDTVHLFEGYDVSTSPYWVLRARVFVPSTMWGNAWLIVLAEYDGGGSGTTYAVSIEMNPAEETIKCHGSWSKLPLAMDEWAEIRLDVNFEYDSVATFYNDELLGIHPWTAKGGALSIGAIDLWSEWASGFYFDDLSLIPTGGIDCNLNTTPDECDIDDGTSMDCQANDMPDECERGDCDGDGQLGLSDLAGLYDCLTGPCGTPPCDPPLYDDPCCVIADFDLDGDHDLADFAAFQRQFGEPQGGFLMPRAATPREW